jgi:hypothetical protein
VKPTKNHVRLWLIALGLAALSLSGSLWAQSYSHARIVRLSFVEGTVTVQRPDVKEWAEAPVNTPIQEGFQLLTAENSFAEVEFENASTIRLGQLTLVEFSQLGIMPDGGKVNHLTLKQGYATFHVTPEKLDAYEFATPNGTLTPRDTAMFRVDIDEGVERVEVLKGSVEVSSSLGVWTLAKNQVLQLRPGSDQPSELTDGITKDAWDEWVSQRESRPAMAQNAPSVSAYTNNPNDLYGWNDLSDYGMWSYLPGYGYGWVPTVSYGWAPYGIGRWCWYPGFGWTWISGDPWGWLPYHYGSWSFMQGVGWAWFPGNFGMWNPAMVTWYGGPGWIGWAPQSAVGGGGGGKASTPCPQGMHCGTVVNVNTFQNGGVVTPQNALPINPLAGHSIDRPTIQPNLASMLPGRALPQANALVGSQARQDGVRVRRMVNTGADRPAATASSPTAMPSGVASMVSRGRVVAPPSTGIAFDPVQGRYVNSNSVTEKATAGAMFPGMNQPAESVGLVSPHQSTMPQEVKSDSAPKEHKGWGWFHHSAPANAGANSGGVQSRGSVVGGSRSSSGGASASRGSNSASVHSGGGFSGSARVSGGGGGGGGGVVSGGGGGHSGGGASGGSHR